MNWDIFWKSSNWEYFDKIGIAAALITMVFSILIWLSQKRREKREYALLDIYLHCPETKQSIKLPGQIRRKNLTRAEVQGLLGILPMRIKNNRYSLPSLNKVTFFETLEDAQINSQTQILIINCSQNELEQFDVNITT